MKQILFLLILCSVGLPGMVSAAETDPIRDGYLRFYQGDLRGAYEHFRRLEERDPNNLAASYGVLSSLYVSDAAEGSLEQEFEKRAQQLLDRAGAGYERDSRDLEALFYLAQTHGLRAGYRIQRRRNFLGGVRDAIESKRYGEAYVKLNPGRADAYLALGLYDYYADLAPSLVKLFRLLLFLPGGNRVEGLKRLEYAAHHGEMWAPQAQLELIQIYGWFEGRVDEALRLAQALNHQIPDNPEVALRLARLCAGPALEDYDCAADYFGLVLQRAQSGHPYYIGGIRYQALLGLAEVRASEWRLAEAVAMLDPVIEAGVADPAWVLPRSRLARGYYRALLNDPEAAEDARRVLAEPKWKEKWHEEAQKQLRWIEERRASGEATQFAELIPGNRLVAEGRWDLAAKFYEQVRQRDPGNEQVRYRLAYLHFRRGMWVQAETEFTQIANGDERSRPGWLQASTVLYLARLRDLRGDREGAVRLYKQIANDDDEKRTAVAARLGLVTPYKQRVSSGSSRREPGK